MNKATSRTVVTTSGSPAAAGTTVSFHHHRHRAWRPESGIPRAPSSSAIDGVNVGAPVALNPSGQAAYATAALPAGRHTVVAVYSGDAAFITSTSAAITQRIR